MVGNVSLHLNSLMQLIKIVTNSLEHVILTIYIITEITKFVPPILKCFKLCQNLIINEKGMNQKLKADIFNFFRVHIKRLSN